MSLKLLKCEEASIACFVKKAREEACGTLVSIESCKSSNPNNVVLGKLIKHIDIVAEEKNVRVLLREVKPDSTYGVKYIAVIRGHLGTLFISAELSKGDRLGFVEPKVFHDPALQAPNDVKCVLEVTDNNQSCVRMLYAKKQIIFPKSMASNILSASGPSIEEPSTRTHDPSHMKQSGSTTNNNQITLPEKAQEPRVLAFSQKPNNVKQWNTVVYKNLEQVKKDALLGSLENVNIIAVVSEITKGLSLTKRRKHTIICKLVDNSVPDRIMNFDCHFFTHDSNIIGQIERGDILRLHGVKVELYLNDVDGRIFQNHSVLVFKRNSDIAKPITVLKHPVITPAEKRRVAILKEWFRKNNSLCVDPKDVTMLSSINSDGVYNVLCKVVSLSQAINGKVILSVSDGSVIDDKGPAPSAQTPSQYDLTGIQPGHLVTDIEVFERLDEYVKIKANDYVYLRLVKACQTEHLKLAIMDFSFPIILEVDEDDLELSRYLKNWESNIIKKRLEMKEKVGSDHAVIPAQVKKSCDMRVANFNSEVQTETFAAREIEVGPFCSDRSNLECHKPCAELGPAQSSNHDKEQTSKILEKNIYLPSCMDLQETSSLDDRSTLFEDKRVEELKRPDQTEMVPSGLSLDKVVRLISDKLIIAPKKGNRSLGNTETQNKEFQNKGDRRTSIKRPSTELGEPILKLIRIDNCSSSRPSVTPEKETVRGTDDFVTCDDASTVINLELRPLQKGAITKPRLELDNTLESSKEPSILKVSSWLLQQEENASNNEGIDNSSIPDQVCPALVRLQAFLLRIVPDPVVDAYNLISGYCQTGCLQFNLYSNLIWKEIDDMDIPFCPNCHKLRKDKSVKLLFTFSLDLMDKAGSFISVIVQGVEAETMLRCSASEFISDDEIRKARVELLTSNTIMACCNKNKVPLLDLTLTAARDFRVVNTELILPTEKSRRSSQSRT